jgi:hypothetical protein
MAILVATADAALGLASMRQRRQSAGPLPLLGA